MFDLALTESGDLFFLEDTEKYKDFKITFNIATGKALNINFKISNSNELIKTSDNDFVISFDIKEKMNNKKALTVANSSALIQAIKIRLMTSLGEIEKNPENGSTLELIKHKALYDNDIQCLAANSITRAIADILPNARIKIVPEINYEFGYSQCLCAYIYSNNKLIYKHHF